MNVITLESDKHEEHPEAYSPRVFFSVVQDNDEGVFYVRHYELLQTGYALQWKTLPEGKIDFMHFIIPTLKAMRMSHKDRPMDAYWEGTLIKTTEQVGGSIPSLEMPR